MSQAKIIFVSSSTLPLTFKEINEYAKMSDLKLGKIVQNRFLKRKIVLETHFLVDVLTDLAIYLLEYVIAFSNSLGLTEKERLDFGADIKPFLMGNTKNIEAHYHDALIQFYKQDAKQKDETVFQDCFLWLLEKLIAKCSHNNPKFHLFWGSFKGLAIRLKNPFKAIPFYVFDLSQFERNFDEVQVPIYRKKRYSEFGIKYLKSLLCGYFSGRSEFHKNDIMDFLWVSDFGAIDTATNYCVTFDKKMADILVNNLHLVVNPRCLLE